MKYKKYVIDTETTGLDCNKDEILQLSIIDDCGKVIFDSYFKPTANEWKEAQAVNGISPDMVKDAPNIADMLDDINEIMKSAKDIIGYNTEFDVSFLRNSGVVFPEDVNYIDVMRLFAPIYGDWSERYCDYKFKNLITCAEYYKFDWNSISEKAHNSLGDCYATLHCYRKMNEHRAVEAESKSVKARYERE